MAFSNEQLAKPNARIICSVFLKYTLISSSSRLHQVKEINNERAIPFDGNYYKEVKRSSKIKTKKKNRAYTQAKQRTNQNDSRDVTVTAASQYNTISRRCWNKIVKEIHCGLNQDVTLKCYRTRKIVMGFRMSTFYQ